MKGLPNLRRVLSSVEINMVAGVLDGKSEREIGRALGVNHETVGCRVDRAVGKLIAAGYPVPDDFLVRVPVVSTFLRAPEFFERIAA
jgi:DNA-binding NarL/FixJ family response regulator